MYLYFISKLPSIGAHTFAFNVETLTNFLMFPIPQQGA